LVKPAGQVVAHPLAAQTSFGPHAWPHWPQLAGSLLSSTHWPPHFVYPGAHPISQAPWLQTGAPWGADAQACPQSPQLLGSLAVSAHAAPQAFFPAPHVELHCPPLHVAVPPGGAVHLAPHPPQLTGSASRSTHWPPHIVWSCAHGPPSIAPPCPP
jgi:hypothetical protein